MRRIPCAFYCLLLVLSLERCAARETRDAKPLPDPNIQKSEGFTSYRIGNPNNVNAGRTPGFLLAGGGPDVDAGMRWLLTRANGGDFLILRASGGDDYNEWLNSLGHANSIETLVITSRVGASQSYVQKRISEAEAIFIAGGGQDDYIQFWKNTPVNARLNEAIERGTPIGGTSAGLAVLGEFIYDAIHGSAVSSEALANPYNEAISFSTDFLAISHFENLITDSHFAARDRMGRLVTYLARLQKDGFTTNSRAIGVDEKTTLAVDASGSAKVMGSGTVYFLKGSSSAGVCENHLPLEYESVQVYKIKSNGNFNLKSWSGNNGTAYSISAKGGKLYSSQNTGAIY